jgi:hypothetical protein
LPSLAAFADTDLVAPEAAGFAAGSLVAGAVEEDPPAAAEPDAAEAVPLKPKARQNRIAWQTEAMS